MVNFQEPGKIVILKLQNLINFSINFLNSQNLSLIFAKYLKVHIK